MTCIRVTPANCDPEQPQPQMTATTGLGHISGFCLHVSLLQQRVGLEGSREEKSRPNRWKALKSTALSNLAAVTPLLSILAPPEEL